MAALEAEKFLSEHEDVEVSANPEANWGEKGDKKL